MIWAGSDDGLVHVTRDNGKTWQNVTPKGIPDWIQINAIDASPRDKGTAYVAATMYKWDDFRPYLYKTSDYGKTWTKIVNGIPDGAFTRVVREDPVRQGLLYAGTELGLYVSFDDGANWQPFQRNLPYTPVTDLAVKNGDLVVATQGRSFWILDDLTALRKWDATIAGSPAYLFPPRPTVRMNIEAPGEEEAPEPEGRNIPAGVVVDYWLKDAPGPQTPVLLEFFDGDALLHSYSNQKPPAPEDLKEQAAQEELRKDKDKPLAPKAGVNRFVWDLRIMKPTLVPKAVFNEGTKNPPKVAPGAYSVRLTVGDKTYTQPIELKPHPAVSATAADLKAQHDLLKAIRDQLSETHATILEVRDTRQQVEEIGARAARLGKGDALAKQATALAGRLTAVEEQLTNPLIVADEDDLNYEPKLDHDWVYLSAIVASADAKPTPASVQYYGVLKGRLDAIRGEYKTILDTGVKDFNRAVAEAKIPPVAPAPKIER